MIFAPPVAASRTSWLSFWRFSSTAPSTDEHWIGAPFTVVGGPDRRATSARQAPHPTVERTDRRSNEPTRPWCRHENETMAFPASLTPPAGNYSRHGKKGQC